jgi:uncharacterized protein
MPAALQAALLLVVSNSFMTYAWYGHLRDLSTKPWYTVALIAWGVAFFEYQFQVPANRIGYTTLTLPQLKILQEVVSLAVFAPFSILYMRAPFPSTISGRPCASSARCSSCSGPPGWRFPECRRSEEENGRWTRLPTRRRWRATTRG